MNTKNNTRFEVRYSVLPCALRSFDQYIVEGRYPTLAAAGTRARGWASFTGEVWIIDLNDSYSLVASSDKAMGASLIVPFSVQQ